MAEISSWTLVGDWFDVCKCDIPCPCEFAQPPTDGVCEGVLVWHIGEGRYGDVVLDGLNVLSLGSFEGNLWTGEATNVRMATYIDDRADEKQRDALGLMFSGQAGGHPAGFAKLIDEVLWTEFAPITFEIAEDLGYWRATVPGVVEAAAEALTGPTTPPGKRVQTLNPPGSEVGPGGAATWGVATANRVNAPGRRWQWDGKSSKHIPFSWSGPE